MNDIRDVYLSNLEWTRVHDDMGGVIGNIIFDKLMTYEDYQRLSNSTHFILCNKDYIELLEQNYERIYNENCKLREEKKIPEKLGKIDDNNGYIDQNDVIKIGKKVDEIIDYLKSKGKGN